MNTYVLEYCSAHLHTVVCNCLRFVDHFLTLWLNLTPGKVPCLVLCCLVFVAFHFAGTFLNHSLTQTTSNLILDDMVHVMQCGYAVAQSSTSKAATNQERRVPQTITISISSDLKLARSFIVQYKSMMFLDVEWHDRDPPEAQRITEIGIVMLNYCGHQTEPLHYIIAEHYDLVQRYVTKDNRKFVNFIVQNRSFCSFFRSLLMELARRNLSSPPNASSERILVHVQ